MTLKAVIFDLDQTLLDRTRSLDKFLNWQVDSLGVVEAPLKSEFIQRFILIDANGAVWKDQVYAQLIREFGIHHLSASELLHSYIQEFRRFSTPFDDVELTIEKLFKHGFKLGLISNGKSPFQEYNFQALGIDAYFSSVIVSEAVHLRKPDPAIFQLSCQQLGVELSEAVYVGDNKSVDVEGAKNAGLQAIYFQPDVLKHELDDHTYRKVSNFKTLLSLLLKNNQT